MNGITQAEFKKVFEKGTPELISMGKYILETAESFEGTRFSATEKAITFSTEVAFGFMRCNSRNIEINLFFPKDRDLDHTWKESRHTSSKKLGTKRLYKKSDLDSDFDELLGDAHTLSVRPRFADIHTKDGFLAALKAVRDARTKTKK